METTPRRFFDEEIQVTFDEPPVREKTPACPNGFSWRGEPFRVKNVLAEWSSFERRGRMKNNMQPAHALRAATRGSWGVGRFFFRVMAEGGRVFDIYYDRAPGSADDRKGHWVLFCERTPSSEQ